MAIEREGVRTRDGSLRRVAIVLQSLPPSTAAKLLGDLQPEVKKRIRRVIEELGRVDPMEQRLALQSFAGSLRQRGSTHASNGPAPRGVQDEVIFSRVVPSAATGEQRRGAIEAASHPHRPEPATATPETSADSTGDVASPLGFLESIEDRSLSEVLGSEHPQTIALVLASIAPAKAARVLPLLDHAQQQEAIRRIGRLGATPEGTLEEIADHLRVRCANVSGNQPHASGRRALDAIMAEMSPSPPAVADVPRSPLPAPQGPRGTPAEPAAEPDALEQLKKLRQIRDQLDPSELRTDAKPPSSPAARQTSPPAASSHDAVLRIVGTDFDDEDRSPSPPASTDEIHAFLIGLTPETLCSALGVVETRVAMLALCGLPTEVADRVLQLLPRGEERQVRRQLASIGPLRLREIDEAKERVAQAAGNPAIRSHAESSTILQPLAA